MANNRINQVWQDAHTLLLAKKWNAARPLLEELSKSYDIVDYMLTPDQYPDCPQHISDRIDAVNARVDRNHSDRDTAWQAEVYLEDLYANDWK